MYTMRNIFTDTIYAMLHNLHCEIQKISLKLSHLQCSTYRIIAPNYISKTQSTVGETNLEKSCSWNY